VQLSISNQVLSTKTAFICVVDEASDAKKQEVVDKGQQKVIVPQLLSQDYENNNQSNIRGFGSNILVQNSIKMFVCLIFIFMQVV
jgi:hypothetical protein